MAVGELPDPAGRPGKISLRQRQLGQRIAPMGVKSGRNDDEIRLEPVDGRKDLLREGILELLAARTGSERDIDDVPGPRFRRLRLSCDSQLR